MGQPRGLIRGSLEGSDVDLVKSRGAFHRELLHVGVYILTGEEDSRLRGKSADGEG